MAEFLITSSIASNIETIIREARKNLVILSPYLQLRETLFERLKDADSKKVMITIIYGKDELKNEQREMLSKLINLDLRYYEHLHAKCYFNEKLMVITSMNMYEFSEKN